MLSDIWLTMWKASIGHPDLCKMYRVQVVAATENSAVNSKRKPKYDRVTEYLETFVVKL